MPDFVKNKFFMIMVVILIVVTVVPLVMNAVGAGSYVKSAVNVIISPVQKLFNYASDAVSGFTDYFTEFDRIVDENKLLRDELNSLKDQVASAEETEKMNDWLYKYLELKREHPEFKFSEADVTGREAGNYMTVFTLDKGTSQGIEVGMPAVTNYGVVGYVTEVGLNWSKVVTLLESGTAIGAFVERTDEIGVVEGSFELSKQGLCKMIYLPSDSTVAEGDRIFTSGYGSVYPRGLLIGYVERTELDANNQTIIAYIRPAEAMTDITKLMIITNYEVTLDE